MSSQLNNYEAVQQKIEAQLRREKQSMQLTFALFSVAIYILFLLVGWSLFLSNGGAFPAVNVPGMARDANPSGDAMMLVSVAGFVPVLFQVVSFFLGTRIGEKQLRDRAAGRVLQAEMLLQLKEQDELQQKAKRAVRLTDDGELATESEPDSTADRTDSESPVQTKQLSR